MTPTSYSFTTRRKSLLLNATAIALTVALTACNNSALATDTAASSDKSTGTSGFVSTGVARTVTDNLFAPGGRIAAVGEISDSEGNNWTMPAATRYTDDTMAFAPDLYNNYISGHSYANSQAALDALQPSQVTDIDASGELITAYIFADNYFELYINGVAVAKDPIPFTEFNSNIVQFRAAMPFTAALLLVDWEENLGTGTEANRGTNQHPGDGGLVAVFHNAKGDIVGVTDNRWKAQTFYTSPIVDLNCLSEEGNQRLSNACTDSAPADLNSTYAVHWHRPENWTSTDFDDSNWPAAVEFSNNTVGVSNKSSYTNFSDIFDAAEQDAQFIWSSNLVLDNEVLVRGIVGQ